MLVTGHRDFSGMLQLDRREFGDLFHSRMTMVNKNVHFKSIGMRFQCTHHEENMRGDKYVILSK